MQLRTKSMYTAAALSVPLLIATGLSAGADENNHVDEIADVATKAAPDNERIVRPEARDAAAVQFSIEHTEDSPKGNSNASVRAPVDAGKPFEVETRVGEPLEISLPHQVVVNDAQVADDGSVVYTAAGSDAHAAMQVLEDGAVRFQTVLTSPSAPRRYSYDLGDVTPVVLEDGSVELLREVQNGVASVLATAEAPWATDANGEPVETWYTVDGNTLIQHVEPSSNAAYPITADPKFTQTWWNNTLYFNRSETLQFTAYGYGAAWIAARFGVPGGAIATAITGYATAFGIYYANGECGKLVQYALGGTPVPQQYGGSEAGGYCA